MRLAAPTGGGGCYWSAPQTPVISNIGKLAASNRPGVLHLVQQILIASAAIPGAFPPEMIDVEIEGRTYQEMHVDGGASAQVFVYPPSLQLQVEARRQGLRGCAGSTLFAMRGSIRNGRRSSGAQ